jgi:DNA repair protein RecN (Recombination protein N)
VTCVTHLAQIAAWADAHYALRKRELGGQTRIELVALADPKARLEEIARMLSGSASGVALDHAQTLLADVRAQKDGAARLSASPYREGLAAGFRSCFECPIESEFSCW